MPYTRYIAITSKGSRNLKDPDNQCFILATEIPETPYIKLKIRIVKYERKYDHNRIPDGFIRRFEKALRTAFKAFKAEI